ncbi:MAG: NUDIX hydrolase [Oscillospiraceae bacterium]|nr:NUDIX hydrolase [Oscillospiraceae bacterium]
MTHFEKQIDTSTVYEGLIVNVRMDNVELINGKQVKREVIVHPGGVAIVPVTNDNKILMVRQYRYCVGEEIIEIPAGVLEAGEEPLNCAIRELSEETGCTAGRLIDLGAIYPSPGINRETLYIYLALDLQAGEMHLDDDEFLSVEAIAIDEIFDMIMENKIRDAKTIVGIMKAKNILDGLNGGNNG